ncbi:Na+/H+ antiporter subunit E [Falsirhodobacter halotolerans]|uniref:Na+/H+ antiporter subunit E n=1 Tax=Falsirhodobacter halotolerans TaxID=1146892 RepID=UPI001FD3BC12|nr:Na+/H+ antiporter subunit E [Falsirhodobacter halotolerans]MCJ8140351.1 Na+/H+ antiporter subunit E [Falsirhodobacter halotolerans]
MKLFTLNLLMAIGWAALWNGFSLPNLLMGYAVGFVGLWCARDLLRGVGEGNYFRAVPQSLLLAGFFIKELVKSCVMVARDCFALRPNLHPAIVRMPLDAHSDAEIFLLANLITLTPGTLTLDVAEDRSFLLIHSIYATDEAALIHELKSGMEHRIGKVFRA